MKPKTLKDLKIVAAVQNRPDKRFQAGVESCKFFLKQEAIKELKELSKIKGEMVLHSKGFAWNKNSDLNLPGDEWRNAIEEYIKWKNNITEEDLK